MHILQLGEGGALGEGPRARLMRSRRLCRRHEATRSRPLPRALLETLTVGLAPPSALARLGVTKPYNPTTLQI
eukprot:1188829-Prorocentrum_minimum.AAC.3